MSDVELSDSEPAVCGAIRPRDVAPYVERMCWLAVILVLTLRWINGPPVSKEQAYMQMALACGAVVTAISLHIYRIVASRRF